MGLSEGCRKGFARWDTGVLIGVATMMEAVLSCWRFLFYAASRGLPHCIATPAPRATVRETPVGITRRGHAAGEVSREELRCRMADLGGQ